MTWTATGTQNSATGSAIVSLNVSVSNTLVSSFIAVGTAVCHTGGQGIAPTALTVSDGGNGNYTQLGFPQHTDLACGGHYLPANNAGGSLTITSAPSGGTSNSYDIFVAAAEFIGGRLQSATAVTNTGSGTTASTGNITPADNDCLMFAVMSTDSGGAITDNAGSEGYTQIADNSIPTAGESGSVMYKILSGGSGSAQSESWSFTNEAWATVIGAFLPDVLSPQIVW
jgi:hypothetical protein